MIDLIISETDLELIVSALEEVSQLEGLGGFTERDREHASDLIGFLENTKEDYDELDFND